MTLINSNQTVLNSKTRPIYKNLSNESFDYAGNPKIIFNRILTCLEQKQKIAVLLKVTDKNNNVFWTKSTFYKENDAIRVVVKEYTTDKVIHKVEKLYNNLIKIENEISGFYANKYLDGYLEHENVTLCKIIYHYLIA